MLTLALRQEGVEGMEDSMTQRSGVPRLLIEPRICAHPLELGGLVKPLTPTRRQGNVRDYCYGLAATGGPKVFLVQMVPMIPSLGP